MRGYGDQLVAERLTAEPGDECDAEAGADQRQVGVELHRGVRDPRAADRCPAYIRVSH